VIERLAAEDPLLTEQIVSQLSPKLLLVFEPEIPRFKDWDQIVKKLKWVLRCEVELLGLISVCRHLVDVLADSNRDGIAKSLQDLTYEYYFLSQDLLLLISEVEYSTWNFLSIFDPDYWFGLRSLPAIQRKFDEVFRATRAASPAALDRFAERFIKDGLDKESVGAAMEALSDWLLRAQKYEDLMLAFAEAEDPAEVFYGFHYTTSAAIDLLSRTLSMKLVLKPLSNQVRDLLSQ
jgi:hypothetical protein